jgi:F-type H+-transporting ATPase subunit b
MPQFDFTTYSSQIFWFIICFSMLYAFSHLVILPRIQAILAERKRIIDLDVIAAKEIDNKLAELQSKTNFLKMEATQKYKSKLEEVTKEASKQREKMIEELKDQTEKASQKSRQELKSFIENSQAKSLLAAQNLAQLLKAKLFRI